MSNHNCSYITMSWTPNTTNNTTLKYVHCSSNDYYTLYQPYDSNTVFFIDDIDENHKTLLTVENVVDTSFVPDIEEKIEEYIYEHFDKDYILENKEYVYQVIQEKAYEITEQVLKDAKEEYVIDNGVMETIIDNIDFNSLYEIVDNILYSPQTMEEKLADVGMSYKDFI